MLPFSIDALRTAVDAGDVTERFHPDYPLRIYNYSPMTAYSNKWNDVTLNCRGLILDADYNIVARPWKKFFNLGQVELPIQFDTPVEVMDKVDGSLGILYPEPTVTKFDGGRMTPVTHYSIATRGSFTSPQALHATEVWDEKYAGYIDFTGVENWTFLFEIVYPGNRIVLDYAGQDDLVLLGAVVNDTGFYVGPREAAACISWPGPVVEVMPYKTLSEANANLSRENSEGFVIRSHNFMLKLKQPDYLDLHKLVTNASPKTVWEQLKNGKTRGDIISAFPDEFHSYIGSMIDPLLMQFDRRFNEIIEGFQTAESRVVGQAIAKAKFDMNNVSLSRADYALEFKKHKDAKYFFLMLDDRSISDVLWQELKPTIKDIEEDEA